MIITLVGLGNIADEIMKELKNRVHGVFRCPVIIKAGSDDIAHAYDPQKEQYLSSKLIASMNSLKKERDGRIVGIVDIDLYAPGLNFVFGEADVISGIAVISLYRLRQEYQGLPPDENLFMERATKEIVHELGHTFGLAHCPNTRCIMHFSNSLADTDWKESNFCGKCCPRMEFLIK